MRKAVIFDLDGTLVDSAPDLLHELKRVMAARGVPIPEVDLRAFIGGGALALLKRGFEAQGKVLDDATFAEIEADFLVGYMENCTRLSRAFDGVVQVLSALQAALVPMVVCTNKRQVPAEKVLEGLALSPFFQHITGRRDGVPAKPDPEALKDIQAATNRTAADLIMVGDSRTDIDFAHNCGMKVVAVSFGYSNEPIESLGADVLIHHWREMPQALEKLGLSV